MCETILPASLQLNKCQSVNKKIDNRKALALHPNRQKCKARIVAWMGYYKRKQDSRTARVDIYALLLSFSLSPLPITEKFSALARHSPQTECGCDSRMCARNTVWPLWLETCWAREKIHRQHGAPLDEHTWIWLDAVHYDFAHTTRTRMQLCECARMRWTKCE